MPRVNATGSGVKVQGLNELNRALRAVGGREMQQELKKAGLDVAQDVASDARGIAMGLGGVAAKTAPSIKAAARFTGAGVSFGGSAYPFAGGAEFGSLKYPQFRAWKGSGPGAGYFIYEAIRDNSDHIADKYLDAVDDLVRKYL